MQNNAPYLSIVVTTRNDNHGGDLRERTTTFVEGIYHQAKAHSLPLELIIVEWNPPDDKPLLKEVLPKPGEETPVLLRYITVPGEIHEKYKMGKEFPLFQMIAKNVGIRRAKGEFILCTNIDLLFSDELFRLLKRGNLDKQKFYRANRCDIPADVLKIDGFEGKMTFAEKNIMNRLGKNPEHEYIVGVPEFYFNFPNLMRLLNLIYKYAFKWSMSEEDYAFYTLDKEACGDFTLMHRDAWEKIQGYVELDLYSIHVDSMAIFAARALGIEQDIFPHTACTYHIFHKDGWSSFADNPVELIKFTEKRPGLDWYSVMQIGKWLIKHKRGWEINPENWGFADREFEEYSY